ncbi:MAG: hypothetical protein JXA78_06450 [Anaerolineales bacterium]|nr:hypothetical protein [Anaerolineales bacterium]
MSKTSKKHGARTTEEPQSPPVGGLPSAQTIYRAKIVDAISNEMILKAQQKLKPLLWFRDGGNVKAVRAAGTAEELLDLIPLANGLAEDEWLVCMRGFGAEALPLLKAKLETAQYLQDVDLRDRIFELLISDLRWRGQAGAKTLLDSFDLLGDYGKSLASLALGLLQASESAERIWSYYQKAVRNSKENYFVGALWGLIDLGDARAAEALYQLLVRQRYFYELMGFLSLAGDQRALIPLLVLSTELGEDDRWDVFMAAVGIVHRMGRAAVFDELREHSPPDETDEGIEALIERIRSHSVQDVQEYFAMFYRGFTAEDVNASLWGEP